MQTSKPTILFLGFLLVGQFLNGLHSARTGNHEIVYTWSVLAFYWALCWWFIHDSRIHSEPWADKYLDMGMFLYIAGIFMIPYYLFKTRGWKALYLIGLFLAVYLGGYVEGVFFYYLVSAF